MSLLQLEIRGPVWYWRGPAPHHFVTVPAEASGDIAEIAGEVTYGGGMIPVDLRLGGSRWTTSLSPQDGQYIVPLKAAVRAAEASGDIAESAGEVAYGGGMIPVELRLGGSRWTTCLWPKDGQYIVPLKAAVRAAESIAEGDVVSVSVTVRVPR